MPISTVWILKYVQQCYVKWFWTISSLGAHGFLPHKKPIETERRLRRKQNRETNREFKKEAVETWHKRRG